MDSRRIGLVAGALAVLSLLARIVPAVLLGRWVDAGAEPGFLPTFGSVGITVSAYTSIVDTIGVVVPVALGLALGARIARRTDDGDLGRGLGAVALGSAVAVLLAATVPVAVWSTPVDLVGLGLFLVVVLQHVVSTALLLTVGAGAGVAADRFWLVSGSEPRRTGDAEGEAAVSTKTDAEEPPETRSTT